MAKALYRKYRSRSLDDVVGQEHVTTLLRNALRSGQTGHAYLFTGPRGVGKTSIARILAHEINGLPYDDESTYRGSRSSRPGYDGYDDAGPRARPGAGGTIPDETHFLNALHEIVASGQTASDEMLGRLAGPWQGDLSRIYAEYSY